MLDDFLVILQSSVDQSRNQARSSGKAESVERGEGDVTAAAQAETLDNAQTAPPQESGLRQRNVVKYVW